MIAILATRFELSGVSAQMVTEAHALTEVVAGLQPFRVTTLRAGNLFVAVQGDALSLGRGTLLLADLRLRHVLMFT